MRKVIASAIMAAGLVVGLAAPAFATGNGWHLKTDICHNGHVVPVSINATSSAQDTGHGLLDLDSSENVQSFTPHNSNGHATDKVLRVYWKKGNDESNTWVNQNQSCTDLTGPEGPEGPQGPQGDPGPQGPEGPQGPKGDKGDKGDKGNKGDKGDKGPRGWPGKPGKNGQDGSNGLTPVAVCTGNPGGVYFVIEEPEVLPENHFYPNAEFPCYGPAGADGKDGVDGVDGKNGTDGTNGTNGVDGKDGVNGSNGTDGAVGPVGPAGLAGPQGPAGGEEATPTTTTTAPVKPVGELPRTGMNWGMLALVGVGLGALGLILAFVGRKTEA